MTRDSDELNALACDEQHVQELRAAARDYSLSDYSKEPAGGSVGSRSGPASADPRPARGAGPGRRDESPQTPL